MDSWLLYLLKVSALTSLFYLLYLLLFSRDTFFIRNRVLLILTLVLPIILPAIKYSILVESPVNLGTSSGMDNIIFSETTSVPTMQNINQSFDYNNLLEWIYFVVLGLMLLKYSYQSDNHSYFNKKRNYPKKPFPKSHYFKKSTSSIFFFPIHCYSI